MSSVFDMPEELREPAWSVLATLWVREASRGVLTQIVDDWRAGEAIDELCRLGFVRELWWGPSCIYQITPAGLRVLAFISVVVRHLPERRREPFA